MKKEKKKKLKVNMLATLLVIAFAINIPGIESFAKENVTDGVPNVVVTVANKEMGYNSLGVQPLTTMFDCEIIMAFTLNGLEMDFTTSCVDIASVIGVKDIKVQQKMWYGWKTVMTSNGAENQNDAVFCTSLTYPDAVNGKTYRVICTHYADYDGYEEVENNTGAFKFIL